MKHYMQILFGALFCLFLIGNISAQRVDRDVFEDRTPLDGLVVGSYFSLMYANGWNVEASPEVGYRLLNDRVVAGVGLQWSYASQVFRNGVSIGGVTYGPGQVRWQSIGPRAFVKVHPFWQIYAVAEYQYLSNSLSYKTNTDITFPLEDGTEQPLFLGVGYASNEFVFARGFSFNAEILIDVMYDSFNSVRSSPLTYRIGVFYGF